MENSDKTDIDNYINNLLWSLVCKIHASSSKFIFPLFLHFRRLAGLGQVELATESFGIRWLISPLKIVFQFLNLD
jgi:hypothetical protein